MRKRIRFNYYIELWLMQKRVLVKESTISRYSEIVNLYIKPYFGNLYINKISDKLIIDYLNKLNTSKRLSNKTIRDIFVLMKQILKYANINVNIKLPKKEKCEIKILTKEDQLILERYICNNLSFCNLGILISLYTGIRIGELCSLKWENINLEKKYIKISNTILRIKDLNSNDNKTKVVINSPKSINSNRIIPIPTQLYELLLIAKKNVNDDNNYLLTNELKYMEPRSYYYNYKKVMHTLGIDQYNFHSLRHTFATRCIEIGFDYKTLSEILGHSDIKMTLSFYVHPTQEIKISNMEKLKFL